LEKVELDEKDGNSVITRVERLGFSPNRACLAATIFEVQTISVHFEPKLMLLHCQRSISSQTTHLASDGSLTIAIKPDMT
jgi:hypothetical protein